MADIEEHLTTVVRLPPQIDLSSYEKRPEISLEISGLSGSFKREGYLSDPHSFINFTGPSNPDSCRPDWALKGFTVA